jgi:hypothetical protein
MISRFCGEVGANLPQLHNVCFLNGAELAKIEMPELIFLRCFAVQG